MEKFLKIYNDYIQLKRSDNNIDCKSIIITHKQVIAHRTIKAYKNYTLRLYLVKQEKNPILLFEFDKTSNSSNPDAIWEELYNQASIALLDFINTSRINSIVEGNYKTDTP